MYRFFFEINIDVVQNFIRWCACKILHFCSMFCKKVSIQLFGRGFLTSEHFLCSGAIGLFWKWSGFGYFDWLLLGFALRMSTVMNGRCFLSSFITWAFCRDTNVLFYFAIISDKVLKINSFFECVLF